MADIIFIIYILSLISGSATIGIGLSVYLKYRRPAIRWFLWFLVSLFLILISFIFSHYSTYSTTILINFDRLAAVFQKTGSLGFILTAPFFYFSLLGMVPGRRYMFVFGVLSLGVIGISVTNLFMPENSLLQLVYFFIFLSMILYGAVIISINFHRIAAESLRRALIVFLLITVIFLPFLILDMNLQRFPADYWIQNFNNSTQPLYFLILNICCIYFVLKYLSQPSLRKNGEFTAYFIEEYNITKREQEIIEHLLTGMSSRDIAEKIYISPKTVENHIYNIFKKLQISNRLQLVQLINSSSEY